MWQLQRSDAASELLMQLPTACLPQIAATTSASPPLPSMCPSMLLLHDAAAAPPPPRPPAAAHLSSSSSWRRAAAPGAAAGRPAGEAEGSARLPPREASPHTAAVTPAASLPSTAAPRAPNCGPAARTSCLVQPPLPFRRTLVCTRLQQRAGRGGVVSGPGSRCLSDGPDRCIKPSRLLPAHPSRGRASAT